MIITLSHVSFYRGGSIGGTVTIWLSKNVGQEYIDWDYEFIALEEINYDIFRYRIYFRNIEDKILFDLTWK